MDRCHDFCDCNNCCEKKHRNKEACDFVKDKICCNWCIPRGQKQDVYVAAGLNVFASGFIHVDCEGETSVKVRFFKDNAPVSGPFTVFGGSCMTFTAANFNRIEVECTGGAGGAANGSDDFCSGKICITPRYQVKCDHHEEEECGCHH